MLTPPLRVAANHLRADGSGVRFERGILNAAEATGRFVDEKVRRAGGHGVRFAETALASIPVLGTQMTSEKRMARPSRFCTRRPGELKEGRLLALP